MDETFLDPVLPFAIWKSRQPTLGHSSKKPRKLRTKGLASQPLEAKWTHNPLGDSLSSHEFYTMQPTIMNQEIRSALSSLINKLGSACSNYRDFQDLSSEIQKLMKGPEHVRFDVCVIGGTGIGKSTFINAILNRPGLASASDATKACTQHATTYEFLPDAADDTQLSNVKIILVDVSTRKKEAQEHIDHYAKVHQPAVKEESLLRDGNRSRHKSNKSDQGVLPKKTHTEEDQNQARTALDYFSTIWKTKNDSKAEEDLMSFLEFKYVHDGTLLRRCLEEQEHRISELGKKGELDHEQNILFKNIPDNSQHLLDLRAVRELTASVWPMVSKVDVATGGPLLRNGLTFTDLPGYGDLNQDRIAIANAFRRRANCEIIVGEGLRLEDSKAVHRHIRSSIHAHGENNTILVVNKLDQHFQTSEEEVQHTLDHSEGMPFTDIMKMWEIMSDMNDLTEADEDNYGTYLHGYAESATKRLKAHNLKANVHRVYGTELSIHMVSSQSWLDWLNPQRGSDPKFGPRMSGIPEIQKALLDKIASENLDRYQLHFFVTLPTVESRIRRILNKSVEEKGFTLCYNKVQKEIQAFKAADRLAIWTAVDDSVTRIFTKAERITSEKKVEALIELWRTRWDVRWNTWNMTLGTNGIPRHSVSRAYTDQDVNWNRDLLQALERPKHIEHEYSASKRYVRAWKDRVMEKLEDLFKSFGEPVATICNSIEETVRQAPVSHELMYRALEAWYEINSEIEGILQGLEDILRASVTQTYRDVTTEEDVGCTIAKITKLPFYMVHSEQYGTGCWDRQHAKLHTILAYFVNTFEDTARKLMKKELKQAATSSLKEVSEKLDLFLVTVQAFFETDANYKTQGHIEARLKLRNWLQTYIRVLGEVQSMFPDRARGHPQPSAKRTRLSYNANTTMKEQVSGEREGWSMDLT